MIKAGLDLIVVVLLLWNLLASASDVTEVNQTEEVCVESDDLTVESSVIEINGVDCNSEDFQLYNQSEILGLNVSSSNFVMDFKVLKLSRLNELHSCCNRIRNIDDITEDTFPNLIVLNLTRNLISNVRVDLFRNLQHLLELDLSFNCLTSFPFKEMFESIDLELSTLDLQGNFIKTLGETPLLENVFMLNKWDLSFNRLTTFNSTNIHVNHLLLNNNQIQSVLITTDTPFHSETKQGIDASNNRIEIFESNGMFRSINLFNNSLRSLRNLTFAGAEILNLTNNQISGISESDTRVISNMDKYAIPQGFRKFRDCVVIDLTGNLISSIDYRNLENYFPSIAQLTLKQNRLSREFLLELIKYSTSDDCDFEILTDAPQAYSSHLIIYISSLLISLVLTLAIVAILMRRHRLQQLKYSRFFITFTETGEILE